METYYLVTDDTCGYFSEEAVVTANQDLGNEYSFCLDCYLVSGQMLLTKVGCGADLNEDGSIVMHIDELTELVLPKGVDPMAYLKRQEMFRLVGAPREWVFVK